MLDDWPDGPDRVNVLVLRQRAAAAGNGGKE
jgi:hypothetical protein